MIETVDAQCVNAQTHTVQYITEGSYILWSVWYGIRITVLLQTQIHIFRFREPGKMTTK